MYISPLTQYGKDGTRKQRKKKRKNGRGAKSQDLRIQVISQENADTISNGKGIEFDPEFRIPDIRHIARLLTLAPKTEYKTLSD